MFGCSVVRLFGYSVIRWFGYSVICLCVSNYSFIHVRLFGYSCSFIRLFVSAVQLGVVLTVCAVLTKRLWTSYQTLQQHICIWKYDLFPKSFKFWVFVEYLILTTPIIGVYMSFIIATPNKHNTPSGQFTHKPTHPNTKWSTQPNSCATSSKLTQTFEIPRIFSHNIWINE